MPLYLQLKHHLAYLVGSGALAPGAPLPSVRQLARQLDIAVVTVQRTYNELQAQGMLVSQSGRGVYVADLAADIPQLGAERSRVLSDLLHQPIAQARGLGFGPDEILAKVQELIRAQERLGGVRRVVYIAGTSEFAEEYRGLLREALGDLPCVVDAVTTSQIERHGDAVLDALEPIQCLVCIASRFPQVRRLVTHRGSILFPLVFDLTEDTEAALVQLPRDAPIGLVAEEHLLPSRRAVVRHYHGTEEHLIGVADSDETEIARVLRTCPVVVHSLSARRRLQELAPPSTRLIELRSRPNLASLSRLRALVQQVDAPAAGKGRDGDTAAPQSLVAGASR